MSSLLPDLNRRTAAAEDEALLAQAQQGDRDAFDSLLRPYRVRLVAFCLRFVTDNAEAEDAVQETMLLAWRNLGDFRGDAALATWLFRIARNHCLNRLRRRTAAVSLDDAKLADGATGPDHVARADERLYSHQIIAAVMARLEPRDRIILWWHYQERMTSDEIARKLPATMKLTDDGVRARLKRNIRPAIDAVRREFEPEIE